MNKKLKLRMTTSETDRESNTGITFSEFIMRHSLSGLAVIAAAMLLASLRLPLWHMHLEAPQYRDEETLKIAVHPNTMKGDLRELKVLNQYIGVHVPATLPQFKWLPWAISGAAMLGIVSSLARQRVRAKALTLVASSLALALLFAAVQARNQMRDIGHKRDQKTVLAGMHDFTPPFLGTTKIAQFTVSSRFGLGAWLIGGALVLQLSSAGLSRLGATTDARGRREASSGVVEPSGPAPYVGGYKGVTT